LLRCNDAHDFVANVGDDRLQRKKGDLSAMPFLRYVESDVLLRGINRTERT